MISLQSHNQVLYHLTQLTSTVSPKSAPIPVKVRRRNESIEKTTNIASQKGVPENAKNYIDMLEKLNIYDIGTTFMTKRNNAWVVLDKLSMSTRKKHLQDSKWRVSYVSGSSFTENKHGFPCSEFTETIVSPAIHLTTKHNRTYCTIHAKNLFSNFVQTRTFKTQRNVKAELERNPSFINRIQQLFNPTAVQNANVHKSEGFKEVDVDNEKLGPQELKGKADKYKDMQYAFLAGYEVGVKQNKRFPMRKLLEICFFVSLVLITFWYTGYKFRNQYNNNKAEINPEMVGVTFDDVQGVDTAKQELRDVVEYLKNPEKFSSLGGKLPKGILITGPPGTGKTLLARAVAGEAGVPFFHMAGSEFDEFFVGQGARRVRDLFKAAKDRAPAVIFIDEIDSVGSKRASTVIYPYANQTINQLLSEMDGFMQNDAVIVLGATNRDRHLDKALTRPGRFDIKVLVDVPDFLGRKAIIDLYLSKVSARDIDVEYLAQCTIGFTGADIENMINQAALRAAKCDAEFITMGDLEYAREKVLMGPEGKLKDDEEINRITACHEAGHALVAYHTKDARPIYKITIVPRGHSLGLTALLPAKDTSNSTKSEILANLDTLMGGRAAEELIFGTERITTGAESDFEKATKLAEAMVKTYGMSEKVGFRVYKSQDTGVPNNEYSPATTELIDTEVKRFLQESYDRAKKILRVHTKQHQQLVDALLKYGTLNADEVEAILNGKKVPTKTLKAPTPAPDPTNHVL